MNLSTPHNFGRRECDRILVRRLSSPDLERSAILWMAFLIWQDFATAREDRRQVPVDSAAMAACDSVAVLEEFIGWNQKPGGFIEAAIDAGFFKTVPVSETTAELVLVDFFPANSNVNRITGSESGGVAKVYKNNRTRADMAVAEQLRLFGETGIPELAGMDVHRQRSGLTLIHQVCLGLQRKFPQDDTWKTSLIPKALAVLDTTTTAQREAVCKWFIKNRENQIVPVRLDFVLDKFREFVPEAMAMFGR